MTQLTAARLYRIAHAASSERPPRITIVTGPDGARWGAWPYGCIQLPDLAHGWLGRPVDGGYQMHRSGTLETANSDTFGPELVRRDMLPLLVATNRVSVTPSRWMIEDPTDGKLVRRLLERSDGGRALVDEALWQAWTSQHDGPVWQVGSRHGAIVWAQSEEAPAKALLLPVYARPEPAPPELAGEAA